MIVRLGGSAAGRRTGLKRHAVLHTRTLGVEGIVSMSQPGVGVVPAVT